MEVYKGDNCKCIIGYEGITFIPDLSKEDRLVREMEVNTNGVIGYEVTSNSIVLIYLDKIHWITPYNDAIIKTDKLDQLYINNARTILYSRIGDMHYLHTISNNGKRVDSFGAEGYNIIGMSDAAVWLGNPDAKDDQMYVILKKRPNADDKVYPGGCIKLK